MNNYKIVEVTWIDISETANGWRTLNKLEEFITSSSEDVVVQVGYLYEEDDTQIVLLSSFFPKGELFGVCTKIPKGCILSMTELQSKPKID